MTTSNLLILMSDEHQARALGCAGHPLVRTPNLDRLAARGLRFTNAYTPTPICVPARAAFATGLYPHQTRLWDNSMPYRGQIPGWGHALQAAGVPVESIGKLHYRDPSDPNGFDVEHIPMNVYKGVGMVMASIRREDQRRPAPGRMLGETIGAGESAYTTYDRAVTAHAVDWLRTRGTQDDRRPWCLYVGLVAPHFPLVCPPEFYSLYPLDRLPAPKLHPDTGYRRHPWVDKQNAFSDAEAAFRDPEERLRAIAAYLGLCSWLDHNVGQIMAALDETGLAGETTVVYTSDHGDNLGARGLWGKSNMYQEAVAVPMIVAGPGIQPGRVETPVSLVDLSETVLDHFEAELPGIRPGRSLYQIAKEPCDPQRVVFSEYHAAGAVTGAFMIRRGPWKYIHYVDFAPELFNLETDPEESTDLAGEPEYRTIRDDLHAALCRICDPQSVDALAHADQELLIEALGGHEAVLRISMPVGATPPPST